MNLKYILIPALIVMAFFVTPISYARAQTATSGVLIAMYIYPTNPAWNTVEQIHAAHPGSNLDIIANVNSGPGGSPANRDYLTGIANMRNAGVNVLGYVFTSYCARPLSLVEHDVAIWMVQYPGTNGILLDQMQNNPNARCSANVPAVSYYQQITAFAKSFGPAFVVGNPGTSTNQAFIGSVDSMIIYENQGTPSISTLQTNTFNGGFPKSNFAYDAFNVPALNDTFVTQSTNYVAWLYITNGQLPNPYNSIPPYLDQEVHLTCGC